MIARVLMFPLALGAVAVIARPAPVLAAEVISLKVSGEASLDGDRPKIAALDDGFRRAVDQVAGTLLPGRLSRAERAAVHREISRRARRFVKSYRVDDSQQGEGRLRVRLTVRVDRDKLAETIKSLGIRAPEAAETPEVTAGVRPPVVVIATWADENGTRPLLGPAVAAVKELGFEASAPESTPVSGSASGSLPLEHDEAIQVARSAGAGGAVVIGLAARTDGAVRATRLVGAVATATVQVLDVESGDEIASLSSSAASFGSDPESAQRRAGEEALRRALARARKPIEARWPAPIADESGVAVTISGVRSGITLQAIERYLGASRASIDIAHRRIARGVIQWRVVSPLSPRRLAALIRGADIGSGSISARPAGGGVEVRVRDYGSGR